MLHHSAAQLLFFPNHLGGPETGPCAGVRWLIQARCWSLLLLLRAIKYGGHLSVLYQAVLFLSGLSHIQFWDKTGCGFVRYRMVDATLNEAPICPRWCVLACVVSTTEHCQSCCFWSSRVSCTSRECSSQIQQTSMLLRQNDHRLGSVVKTLGQVYC